MKKILLLAVLVGSLFGKEFTYEDLTKMSVLKVKYIASESIFVVNSKNAFFNKNGVTDFKDFGKNLGLQGRFKNKKNHTVAVFDSEDNFKKLCQSDKSFKFDKFKDSKFKFFSLRCLSTKNTENIIVFPVLDKNTKKYFYVGQINNVSPVWIIKSVNFKYTDKI